MPVFTQGERHDLRRANILLIVVFAVSLLAYLALNVGAYGRVVWYTVLLHSPFVSDELKGQLFQVANASLEGAPVAGADPGTKRLVIPKIGVDAPIISPKSGTMQDILASLEAGVGLYPESNPVGTPSGRSVILGHSSRAAWYRGDYANIFALLPSLEPLDEFFVVGDGKKYVYRVFSSRVLTPSEANEVLSGYTSGSEIDLITCYPIGTSSKRNLVQASLVSVEEI